VIGRVASMVSTNEQLSLAQLESEISPGVYLTRLCEGFARDERIDIAPRIQDTTVTLRTAVRLGIIVNELVTNAIKHAFDGGRGTISVNFAVAEPEGVVTVADNGHGIRGGRPGGAGTGLIASLAEHRSARRSSWRPGATAPPSSCAFRCAGKRAADRSCEGSRTHPLEAASDESRDKVDDEITASIAANGSVFMRS